MPRIKQIALALGFKVVGRVANEAGIEEPKDLPDIIKIGRRVFKKSVWEPEQGSGVKARWFEVDQPNSEGDGMLTWIHNDIEFHDDMMCEVFVRINTRKTKIRSAQQLATMIQQRLDRRPK